MEVWQRLDLIFIFDFFVCQYLASPSIECNVGFVLHNTSLSCPRSIISGLFQYFFRWLFCGIDGLQLPDEPENLATVFANLDPPKLSCPTQIQMEKNTGANTSTSQIQTANTSENHPPELSSAVLLTNPSFTAAVRLNLIWDSCILEVFPSIASYVVNGDKLKVILSTTLFMEKSGCKKVAT